MLDLGKRFQNSGLGWGKDRDGKGGLLQNESDVVQPDQPAAYHLQSLEGSQDSRECVVLEASAPKISLHLIGCILKFSTGKRNST